MQVIFHNPQEGKLLTIETSNSPKQAVREYCLIVLSFNDSSAVKASNTLIVELQNWVFFLKNPIKLLFSLFHVAS